MTGQMTADQYASDQLLKEIVKGIPFNEDYQGIGYLVTIIYQGALEDEITLSDISLAELEERIKTALDSEWLTASEDDQLEVWINEVYIGEDAIENTGYEPMRRYTV